VWGVGVSTRALDWPWSPTLAAHDDRRHDARPGGCYALRAGDGAEGGT
jgi:hypothetical protein